MFFNSLTWNQRLLVTCGALALTIPLVFHLNEVNEVRRLSRIGVVIEAQIVAVHPAPRDSRAYSLYRYAYDGQQFSGRMAGAGELALGARMKITVDPSAPANSWPGEASAAIGRLVWQSLAGAVWLAAGAALLCGPRKKVAFPKNHVLSD